jgi:hypothetical protein
MIDPLETPKPSFDLAAYRAEREKAGMARIAARMVPDRKGVRVERAKRWARGHGARHSWIRGKRGF